MFEFSTHYAEYVKEMDEEMWNRAIDYSKTFTKVDGVEISLMDEKHEDG